MCRGGGGGREGHGGRVRKRGPAALTAHPLLRGHFDDVPTPVPHFLGRDGPAPDRHLDAATRSVRRPRAQPVVQPGVVAVGRPRRRVRAGAPPPLVAGAHLARGLRERQRAGEFVRTRELGEIVLAPVVHRKRRARPPDRRLVPLVPRLPRRLGRRARAAAEASPVALVLVAPRSRRHRAVGVASGAALVRAQRGDLRGSWGPQGVQACSEMKGPSSAGFSS